MLRSVATRPPSGSWRSRSTSSWRDALEKPAASFSAPPGASSRSMARLVVRLPPARSREPASDSSAAWPTTGSAKTMRSNWSAAIWIETGSSGSEKGFASAWGSAGAAAGASGRRDQVTRSAPRRLTETRPRSRARRLQSSSMLSSSSQTPLASETVTLAIRARDDSAPLTPLRRIWRPGAESRFSSRLVMKPLSLPPPVSSWAIAVMATSTSAARRKMTRFKTLALCRCRRRAGNRPDRAGAAWRGRSAARRCW